MFIDASYLVDNAPVYGWMFRDGDAPDDGDAKKGEEDTRDDEKFEFGVVPTDKRLCEAVASYWLTKTLPGDVCRGYRSYLEAFELEPIFGSDGKRVIPPSLFEWLRSDQPTGLFFKVTGGGKSAVAGYCRHGLGALTPMYAQHADFSARVNPDKVPVDERDLEALTDAVKAIPFRSPRLNTPFDAPGFVSAFNEIVARVSAVPADAMLEAGSDAPSEVNGSAGDEGHEPEPEPTPMAPPEPETGTDPAPASSTLNSSVPTPDADAAADDAGDDAYERFCTVAQAALDEAGGYVVYDGGPEGATLCREVVDRDEWAAYGSPTKRADEPAKLDDGTAWPLIE